MGSIVSGKVSPSPGGTVLTFTNTGTYSLPFVSQVLTVYDCNGNVAYGPFNMGQNLTQTVNITADGWFSFVNVITDQTGALSPIPVNYLAEGIYIAAFLNRLVANGCNCMPQQFCTMFKAQLNEQAAEWFAIPGLGVASQSSITAANVYINMNNQNVNF